VVPSLDGGVESGEGVFNDLSVMKVNRFDLKHFQSTRIGFSQHDAALQEFCRVAEGRPHVPEKG